MLTGDDDITVRPKPPHDGRRIYVNRNMRMDTVCAIGFDMDYTLARYRREKLEHMAHRLTVQKLIERGYPHDIAAFVYDPNFVVRGLVVDKQLGNIIKLDRHNHAARVFHGRRKLTKDERRNLYRREKLHFTPPRFALVDTLFSLPEVCLYADLIDFMENRAKIKADAWRIFEDIRSSIDETHRDGSLKSIVQRDFSTYVERDPLLPKTLHKLRSSGKTLFLITNSQWEYTQALMTYLLDDALPDYSAWHQYFHRVVVGAQKPEFFTQKSPLLELDANGEIASAPHGATKFFCGGNLHDFERRLGLYGEDILYVGDHIYADILRSKKHSLWRTALIIEELEAEIAHAQEHAATLRQLAQLEASRRELDDVLNIDRHRLIRLEEQHGPAKARALERYARLRGARREAKTKLQEVLSKLEALRAQIDDAFNPHWGMVFKEDRENSRFGDQVQDYACVYTSRVSNFYYYSSHQYFRSLPDLMPHERFLG